MTATGAPTLLLIVTAHPEASVSLWRDSRCVATEPLAPDDHAAELLAHVDTVLQQNNLTLAALERIAVYRGPGSFSRLRTGVVAATMLAHASGTTLVSVTGTTLVGMVEAAWQASPTPTALPIYQKYTEK